MRKTVLTIWYRLQIYLLGFLVGSRSIEVVLSKSLFPRFVLELGGAKIGRATRIYPGLMVHESAGSFEHLVIGDNVHIGKCVFLDLTAPLTIGNRVGVGMFSKVLTHQNLGDTALQKHYEKESGPVNIPDDVVLAAASIVLYPTCLAAGSLVSAGSVVRGSFDKPCLLMGNPARIVKYLANDEPKPADT